VKALIYAATTELHWGSGRTAEAHYRRALRLSPADPMIAHAMGGLSRLRLIEGRFEGALRWSERALSVNHNYGAAHWSRIAASALLGRNSDAERHAAAFGRTHAGVTVSRIRRAQPTRASSMTATLEGLEMGGLPQ
jgi:tetratricopeptide (TPR) repeat protein